MDIKFKTKEGVIKGKLFNRACTIFMTPCPHRRTNWSGTVKKVGDMGCMRCPECNGIDWDESVCHCRLEKKKPAKAKSAKTVKRKMPRKDKSTK